MTRNEMTVRAIVLPAGRIDATGTGYATEGRFQVEDQDIDPASNAALDLASRIGLLRNDAKIDRAGPAVTILGDPTEAALIATAEKAGMDHAALLNAYPRAWELPFSSETKVMVTVHGKPGGGSVAYVKGAPGTVLAACVAVLGTDGATPVTPEAVQLGRAANDTLAAGALRVLALAYRDLPEPHDEADLSRALTLVGHVGMMDPLRDGVVDHIARCRAAGIRVVMITGDHQATVAEIARQLGLDADAPGKPMRIVHGRELEGLDADGWNAVSSDTAVFARVSLEHKLNIVDALQRSGQVVAMTGDGENDAPALRKADIGIAMGIRGTEVAKSAADMVITDDNFSTIVAAVEQGRVIVHNAPSFIH